MKWCANVSTTVLVVNSSRTVEQSATAAKGNHPEIWISYRHDFCMDHLPLQNSQTDMFTKTFGFKFIKETLPRGNAYGRSKEFSKMRFLYIYDYTRAQKRPYSVR